MCSDVARYNPVKDEDGAHAKMLESKNKKNKKKGKDDWTWKEQVRELYPLNESATFYASRLSEAIRDLSCACVLNHPP